VSGGLREKILPARVVCVWTVTIFSLLALDGLKWAVIPVLGEFCTGLALRSGLLGEFCAGLALRWGMLGEFCTVGVRCVAGGWWSAGKDSPCSGCLRLDREKVLPARARWAEMGVFCCAGRVLYRLALRRGLPGEFCTGCGHVRRVRGEFCTGCGHARRVLGEFCTGEGTLRG